MSALSAVASFANRVRHTLLAFFHRNPVEDSWPHFLWQYLRPFRGRFAVLAVLLFGGIGLQLAGPQFIRSFIDT
ncbi:MAG: hypothetical protein ACRDHP_09445, partial [Ktedonobacterales bacterium]